MSTGQFWPTSGSAKARQLRAGHPTESWGAHRAHCCARHGCVYGYLRAATTASRAVCPVAAGELPQNGPCEQCAWELDEDGSGGSGYLDAAYAANALYDTAYEKGRRVGFGQGWHTRQRGVRRFIRDLCEIVGPADTSRISTSRTLPDDALPDANERAIQRGLGH